MALDGLGASESSGDSTRQSEGEFNLTFSDRRKIVLRSIKERRGQQRFRQKLLRALGGECIISGCRLVDLLEAAHIAPYLGESDNHVSNGLLLRADLHTLFDLNLLAIDPRLFLVRLHPRIASHGYDGLEGKKLSEQKIRALSLPALEHRWSIFQDSFRSKSS